MFYIFHLLPALSSTTDLDEDENELSLPVHPSLAPPPKPPRPDALQKPASIPSQKMGLQEIKNYNKTSAPRHITKQATSLRNSAVRMNSNSDKNSRKAEAPPRSRSSTLWQPQIRPQVRYFTFHF